MISTAISIIAAISYGLGSFFQRQNLTSEHTDRRRVMASGVIAVLTQLAVIVQINLLPEGLDLGFFKVASLVSWVIVVTVMISSWKKPLDNLFLYLFPLALICLLASNFIPSSYEPQGDYTTGVALH
ncbi:MAG: hypothetical protein VW337_08735, partial [Gammaproteobacteria bacterium]